VSFSPFSSSENNKEDQSNIHTFSEKQTPPRHCFSIESKLNINFSEMDGHWCVRALLQFLKRKVQYQKFAAVPPPQIAEPASSHDMSDGPSDTLLLKQRARATTTCFFFTDMRAKAKLSKPIIILVMDLSKFGEVVLTIFRHSPNGKTKNASAAAAAVKVTPLTPSCVNEEDMEKLRIQFEKLSLNEKFISESPSLTLLTGPITITHRKSSLTNALKSATATLSDFPENEFDTIIVIGGRGEGMGCPNENSMNDSSHSTTNTSHHPSCYDDNVQLPFGHTWNLLLLLESNNKDNNSSSNYNSWINRPSLAHTPHFGPTIDLANIPIIVHLGGGNFPSACGNLPAGLLTNYAWGDSVSGIDMLQDKSIPRSVGFDLDQDALSDNDEDEDDENDDDDGDDKMNEENRGTVSPLTRKRDEVVDEVEIEQVEKAISVGKTDRKSVVVKRAGKCVKSESAVDVTDATTNFMLHSMKRCRIEEGECQPCSSDDDDVDDNADVKDGKRKSQIKPSELVSSRNHGSPQRTRTRDLDDPLDDALSDRPLKRLFRCTSFEKVIPTSVGRPLATVVEGQVLDASKDKLDTLNFSLPSRSKFETSKFPSSKSKSSKSVGFVKPPQFVSGVSGVDGSGSNYSKADMEEGSILWRQRSSRNKTVPSGLKSRMVSDSFLPCNTQRLSPINSPDCEPVSSSSGSTDGESPSTSGDDSTDDDEKVQEEDTENIEQPLSPPFTVSAGAAEDMS
jgi:hypothetical protein